MAYENVSPIGLSLKCRHLGLRLRRANQAGTRRNVDPIVCFSDNYSRLKRMKVIAPILSAAIPQTNRDAIQEGNRAGMRSDRVLQKRIHLLLAVHCQSKNPWGARVQSRLIERRRFVLDLRLAQSSRYRSIEETLKQTDFVIMEMR